MEFTEHVSALSHREVEVMSSLCRFTVFAAHRTIEVRKIWLTDLFAMAYPFFRLPTGMADSQALVQATSTYQACQTIGMPECEVSTCTVCIFHKPFALFQGSTITPASELSIKDVNALVYSRSRN